MLRVATLVAIAAAQVARAQPYVQSSTYLGGSALDCAFAVAAYPGGGAVVAGNTSSATTFPVTMSLPGFGDGTFVTRFNASLSAPVFSVKVGSPAPSTDLVTMAVDAAGNIYVAGIVGDANLKMVNPIQGTFGGGSWDAYVVELSPTGTVVFSTFFGGTGNEQAFGIAVDAAGYIYLVGVAPGAGVPTTPGAFQPTWHGGDDGFVAKLDPLAHQVVFATYLGGSGGDNAMAVAADGQGGLYVAGTTSSSDFPAVAAAYPAMPGGIDGTLTRIGADGGVIFSTFIGGGGFDELTAAAARPGGGVFAAGHTGSTDMPTVLPVQATNDGGEDVMLVGLGATGAVLFQTYLGGAGNESAFGVAAGASREVIVTGSTSSSDFPLSAPVQAALQQDGGEANAFVTKLGPDGQGLQLSTFLGGGGNFVNVAHIQATGGESGNGIAVDSSGSLFIAGETSARGFPSVAAYQGQPQGGGDAFLTKISWDAGVADSGAVGDAGVSDAGSSLVDAGVDGGSSDAGGVTPDAGNVVVQPYGVNCGCDAALPGAWWLAALFIARRLSRPGATASSRRG